MKIWNKLASQWITSNLKKNSTQNVSPKSTTDTLQRVLNAAARLVTNTHKYDHGLSSLLHDQLHGFNSLNESSSSSLLWSAGV